MNFVIMNLAVIRHYIMIISYHIPEEIILIPLNTL